MSKQPHTTSSRAAPCPGARSMGRAAAGRRHAGFRRGLLAAVIVLTGVVPASAQQTARVFILVNGGLQALTRNFSEEVVFPPSGGVYREVLSGAAAQEQARFESSYRLDPGMLVDVSGGVHVGRHLGFGVGVSRVGASNAASLSAEAPHPLFFNRDRSISGRSTPLTRTETALHLQARVMAPLTESVTVTVFGGPTLFNVAQQLVTDVRFTHEYPYDAATFSSADLGREFGSKAGFHLGADIAYYFSSNVGIGWFVRYSRATVELPSGGDDTLDTEVGGLHTAGGLRLRF